MIYIVYSNPGTIIEVIPTSRELGGTPHNVLILENQTLGDLPSDIMENYYIDNGSITLKQSLGTDIFCTEKLLEVGNYKYNSVIRGLPNEACEVKINNTLYQVEEGMTALLLPTELLDNTGSLAICMAGKYKSNVVGITVCDLSKAKETKYQELKVIREEIEKAGAPTPKGLVDITGLSLSKIQMTSQRALLSDDSFTIDWTMFNNSKVPHSKQEFLNLSLAVSEHINNIQAKKEELKSLIFNSTNIMQLNGIAIDINWPGQPQVDPILNKFPPQQ